MTDTSRDAKVTAWHLDMTQKLDALRTQWAAEAVASAARPQPVRRTAGPADAAVQARQADEARQLAQVRAEWLIAMERAAMDIVMIGMD
jgi:hypothetical protein